MPVRWTPGARATVASRPRFSGSWSTTFCLNVAAAVVVRGTTSGAVPVTVTVSLTPATLSATSSGTVCADATFTVRALVVELSGFDTNEYAPGGRRGRM